MVVLDKKMRAMAGGAQLGGDISRKITFARAVFASGAPCQQSCVSANRTLAGPYTANLGDRAMGGV